MGTVVYIYGPPAVGKLTVASSLQQQTGFRLFHNHLTVNALVSVTSWPDLVNGGRGAKLSARMVGTHRRLASATCSPTGRTRAKRRAALDEMARR